MAEAEWHGGAAGRCWRGGGGRDGGGPAGVAVAGVKAAGEAAAAGVSSAGTVAVGVALAGAGQWSSRSVAAAVWPRQQLGSSSNMVYCMENEPAVRRPVSAHVDLHRRFT